MIEKQVFAEYQRLVIFTIRKNTAITFISQGQKQQLHVLVKRIANIFIGYAMLHIKQVFFIY